MGKARKSNAANLECVDCLYGKYSDKVSSSECKECGVGFYQGSAGKGNCEECSSGTYTSNQGNAFCTVVNPGEYQVYCTNNSNTGCKGFKPCEVGKYCSGAGTMPQSCSPGSYTKETGAITCTLCSPGKYSNKTENDEGCTSCSPSTYSDASGLTECKLCHNGQWSDAASTYCTSCAAGQFLNNNVCLPCPNGTFAKVGKSACTKCPAGKVTNQDIPHPKVTGYNLSSECIDCYAGMYSDMVGATNFDTCKLCPAGKFSASKGLNSIYSCNDCAPGKFSNVAGATSENTCQVCQSGLYSSSFGSFSCVSCPKHLRPNNETKASCEPCLGGTYLDQTNFVCINCPAGHFCVEGVSKPTKCNKGEIASKGADSCTKCEFGKYNDEMGQNTCKICQSGKYQDLTGQSSCTDCPKNTYSEETGNTAEANCLKCDVEFGLQTTTDETIGNIYANTSCLCKGVVDANDVNDRGYFKNPIVTDEVSNICKKCPLGSICNRAGISVKSLESVEGYWRMKETDETFYSCDIETDCIGGNFTVENNYSSSVQCRENHAGILCFTCIEGYARTGGICTECEGTKAGIGGFIGVGMSGFVIYFLFMTYRLLRMLKKSGNSGENEDNGNIAVNLALEKIEGDLREKSGDNYDLDGILRFS